SLLTRSTNDVQVVQQWVHMGCATLTTAAFTGIGGVLLAIHLDPALSLVLLIALPVLGVANHRIIAKMMPCLRAGRQMFDNLSLVMREQLSGIRVIRAFNGERRERERFAAVNTTMSDTALTATRW